MTAAPRDNSATRLVTVTPSKWYVGLPIGAQPASDVRKSLVTSYGIRGEAVFGICLTNEGRACVCNRHMFAKRVHNKLIVLRYDQSSAPTTVRPGSLQIDPNELLVPSVA